MLGTFLLPFRHLSLDHSRIDPVMAWLRTLSLYFPEDSFVPTLQLRGCLALALGQPAFQDLKTSRER